MAPKVLIYTTNNCSYCVRAKLLLDSKHVTYTEIHVDTDIVKREEMVQRSGRRTVPQIFINDQSIGGYDDLAALAKNGTLDQLLSSI